MDRSETQVRDWVDGVGNEVVLGGGLLSAVVILVIAAYVLSDGRRRDVHPERAASVMATRMELVREGRQGAGQRGGVGDSAEPRSCPICLSHLSFPVDTNCGHTFCAECILSYWQHDQWPQPARCAVCRSQVVMLLPCAALSSSVNSDLWRRVVDYNQRMSGQPRPVITMHHCHKHRTKIMGCSHPLQLLHYLYDVPVIAGHIWRLLFTVQGVVLLYRLHILLLLLLVLLYLLSPLDLIPEALFGALGLLDDLVILVAVISYATLLYRHYIMYN